MMIKNIKNSFKHIVFLGLIGCFSACSTYTPPPVVQSEKAYPQSKSQKYFKVGSSYKIKGQRYTPYETYNFTQTGVASWYGPGFHGKKTANGEVFNKYDMTAAHKTLQLPSIVKVTNLENNKAAILRVNDRGPFAQNRIIDVSEQASRVLGFKNAGTARVKVEVLPLESKKVAYLAKQGRNTRGYEVAIHNQYNKTGTHPTQIKLANLNTTRQKPHIIRHSHAAAPSNDQHLKRRSISRVSYEKQMRSAMAKKPFNNKPVSIAVGDYTSLQDAKYIKGQLSSLGQTKVVSVANNDIIASYRVEIGPFANTAQARSLLSTLHGKGHKNAIIRE